jgi:uncharacterized protein YpiB (UPF0302 family)
MRWQEDKQFCKWLLEMQYAKEESGKLLSYLTGGVMLYMYEAYLQGIRNQDK